MKLLLKVLTYACIASGVVWGIILGYMSAHLMTDFEIIAIRNHDHVVGITFGISFVVFMITLVGRSTLADVSSDVPFLSEKR